MIGSAGTTSIPSRPGTPAATVIRPIPAVAAISATSYARFAQAPLQAANVLAASLPTVEIVDVATGQVRGATPSALESPLSTLVGNARLGYNGRTMAVDPTGTTAYVLTASGLSVVPLETPTVTERPAINNGGVVNLASYRPDFAPGSLISIFGRNLGSDAVASSAPWPSTLGGACVTLNNNPIPVFSASAGQINAQLPTDLTAGTYTLLVRSPDRKVVSTPANIRVTAAAPAVFVDPTTSQAAVFHAGSGRAVDSRNPASRDDRLTIYGLGFGRPTSGPRPVAGNVTPNSPLAELSNCKVYFGDPTIREAEMDVEWCGLVPGLIGVYQVNIYVPWYVIRGDRVPVTVRIGTVDSPSIAPVVPFVTVR